MSKLSRYWVCDGDMTTAGGQVIATPTTFWINQKQVAVEGDKVQCPACKSVGVIKCVPPIRPFKGPDGRQISADGDLCICKCPAPVRIKSSQTLSCAGFSNEDIAANPGAARWLVYAGHLPLNFGHSHDLIFNVKDKKTGEPLANAPYKITLENGHEFEGKTDASGNTEKVYSNASHIAKIEAPYHGNIHSTTHTAHGSDACGC